MWFKTISLPPTLWDNGCMAYKPKSSGDRRFCILTNKQNLSRAPFTNCISHRRKRRTGKSGKRMTQQDLAAIIGQHVNMVSRYEQGHKLPGPETLFLLCAALETTPKRLYPELWQRVCQKVEKRRQKLGMENNLEPYVPRR